MNRKKAIDLYELLPVAYRLRDEKEGYKLKGLLDIISEQADIIKKDIDGLWDDFFIETCREWVIPYIADLVGNNPLHEVGARRRADVAKTIYYRRRKGTLPMLEEMARDVTGWGAHIVPFFELLGWTQNLNHQRYEIAPNPGDSDPSAVDRVGTVNLRNLDALDLLDSPLDIISHSVDVRSIGRTEGWYGIRKIGFFFWRLRDYPVGIVGDPSDGKPHDLIKARQSEPPHAYGYHFSPLGNTAPIFNKHEPETDEAGLSREINLPGPIRPMAFGPRIDDYYEANHSLYIVKDGEGVPSTAIVSQDLSNWDRPPSITADGKKVAVDVKMGRITFSCGDEPKGDVGVYYNYGFSADLGGGPYERRDSINIINDTLYVDIEPEKINEILVSKYGLGKFQFKTLQKALEEWEKASKDDKCKFVITILDNATYEESISLKLPEKKWLAIRADNRKRPHLKLKNDGILNIAADSGAELTLNGLLIEGAIHVKGSLENLNIVHGTLVPGLGLREDGKPKSPNEASIRVEDECTNLHLLIDHSIVGSLALPSGMVELTAIDSIIDGGITGNINAGSVKPPVALVSGILSPWPTISSDSPAVNVTIGKEGPFLAEFKHRIVADIEEARSLLQAAIREAHSSPAFRKTRVDAVDVNLVIMPGVPSLVAIETTETDKTTAEELKLVDLLNTPGSSLASTSIGQSKPATVSGGKDQPGPQASLERVTVFGKVHVKELRLACDVIFTDIVHSERQQAGCVRFSYVPENSKTPRRYHCQPDMALDAAKEIKGELKEDEIKAVYARMRPSFTSVRYGNPAYAQLSQNCAQEIRTGAEDGSEMGAFGSLLQPQREANLRIRLEEYLPFGLEAGIIYVT
ncbi:MAG: hypothetical protein NTY37_12955 [Methanothrix sp.]|nr:hypothetical protein [Methanothrix sp.]